LLLLQSSKGQVIDFEQVTPGMLPTVLVPENSAENIEYYHDTFARLSSLLASLQASQGAILERSSWAIYGG